MDNLIEELEIRISNETDDTLIQVLQEELELLYEKKGGLNVGECGH
jgi:aerobic-type carbon monoxide dehydrogenase small subunit (CoxS/CutS family)